MEKSFSREYRFSDRSEYLKKLYSAPQSSHIYTRDTVRYIPIHLVEAMADIIYYEWNVIDVETQIAAHTVWDKSKGQYEDQLSVLTKVVIEATPDYPDAMPERFVGVGATPLKGIKNAYEMDYPGSKAKAITNAFSEKGNVFGRNVNRKDAKKNLLPSDFTLRR